MVGGEHKSVVHQIGPAEGLAFKGQRRIVDAVQFGDGIHGIGLQSSHPDDGEVLVLHRLEFVPEEDGFVLLRGHVHQCGLTVGIIGRIQAVKVAVLHRLAYKFIVADGLPAEVFLLVAHVLGLYFHTQASAHRHIAAELQRGGSENGMIGYGGDVRCHGNGGIEVGCSPLHVDALQGIGVVAHPEFVEVRQQSVVYA